MLTIKSIKATPVLVPLVRPITTAVASIPKAPLVLIDVETHQGIVGHSYLFTYTPMALEPLCELLRNVAATLVEKPVDPVARFAELDQMFRLLGPQGLVAMAIAGLDMAFWDAHAKAKESTVASMLGAEAEAVRCYDSHGIFDVARDTRAVEQSLEMGFQAVKFKIGGSTLTEDVATLRAIRDIIGSETRLMIDYNQSLTATEAVRRITRFEQEFDLDWVEEPVHAEDFAGHRAVRENVRTPIQSGENWWMPCDAARAVQANICDHAMLDIMKIGGVTGWMRATSIVDAASLQVSSHIFVEASSHVLAATPNRHLLEYLDVASAILQDPYEITDGCLTPKGPGLGISWNASAVKKYSY